jgi:hypothetical protein
MNKKHYEELASIIKSSVGVYTPSSMAPNPPENFTRMIFHDMFMKKLCNFLKQDNEKFDEKKFRSFADPFKN